MREEGRRRKKKEGKKRKKGTYALYLNSEDKRDTRVDKGAAEGIVGNLRLALRLAFNIHKFTTTPPP